MSVTPLPDARALWSEDVAKEIDATVANLKEQFDGKLAGFAIVAWSADAISEVNVMNSSVSQIPRNLLPAFVAECVRERLWEMDARAIVAGKR